MSKIICDVCGTSYPDTATQCPICGCVRPGEAKSVKSDKGSGVDGGYSVVKGGRFSKSNVRKRNKNSGTYKSAPSQISPTNEPEEKDNKGLVIAAIVLLLAIVAVLIYISVQFFLPQNPDDSSAQTSQSEQSGSTASSSLEIPCESLKLDATQIVFDKADISRIIYPTAEPKNTTDKFIFESSDESVVIVDGNGLVTPVGRGQATITVTCGDVVAQCTVECTFELPNDGSSVPDTGNGPDEEFRLNREDITFYYKGEIWVIYGGDVDMSLIAWESDDETVAAISNGKVVAVGNGETVVRATYNGKTVSCIIRCSFKDDTNSGSSGNVTEDGSDNGAVGPYKLKNLYGGRTDDVSLGVGTSFIMQLVDANGKKVQGVVWMAADESVCTVTDGTVKAVGRGKTTVTASYQDVQYSFTVRVN